MIASGQADNRRKPVSLARALTNMALPHGMNGTPENEFFETVAKLSGLPFDRQRIVIPLGLLRTRLNGRERRTSGPSRGHSDPRGHGYSPLLFGDGPHGSADGDGTRQATKSFPKSR